MTAQTEVFCASDEATLEIVHAFGSVAVRPPAGVGHVLEAVDRGARRIVLVDLDPMARPRLGHHEVLDALRRGVAVAGGAGTGALLAWDLRDQGAHPLGAIAQHVCGGDVVDESAIWRGEVADAVSHATVEVTLSAAAAVGVIDELTARALTHAAGAIPWPARTWQMLTSALVDHDRAKLLSYLHGNGDARRTDLVALGAWLDTPVATTARLPPETASWARARRALRDATPQSR